MDSITRYVFRQLLGGMILVTAGLTAVIWLTQSLRFVEMIVNRGLTPGSFLYLTMLLLPNFLALIMPIALFAVVTFTYTRLTTDRELVVMRAAGLSQWALAKPAIILATLVMLVIYSLNLYFLPKSYEKFRDLQWDIRYNYSHILLQEGAFNTVSAEITVYVRERTDDGQLLGILVHDSRKPDKPSTIMAERGAVVGTNEGPRFVVFNGNRQEVDRSTHKMSVLYFDKYAFDLSGTKGEEAIRYREPRERMVDELFDIEKDKLLNWKDYGKFRIEGHKRLTSPFFALAYTFIALACLISGAVTRRGQTVRVIAAVAMVVLMQGASLGLENVAAKNLALVPLLYVLAIAPIVAGMFGMHRKPMRNRKALPDDGQPQGAAT